MLLFLPSHRQPRSGLPLRGSPPGRESGAHAALSCSPARRRRKLIGFLRRERRFDVVSYIVPLATMYIVPLATISSLGYNELAPYFMGLSSPLKHKSANTLPLNALARLPISSDLLARPSPYLASRSTSSSQSQQELAQNYLQNFSAM